MNRNSIAFIATGVKADGGEAPLPIRAAARLPIFAPVGRLRFRSAVRTRILRIRRIFADWLIVVPTYFSPLTKVFGKRRDLLKNGFRLKYRLYDKGNTFPVI